MFFLVLRYFFVAVTSLWDGEFQNKYGPLPSFTLCGDRYVQQIGDLSYQRKSKTVAFLAMGSVSLVELVIHMLHLLLGQADAGIPDGNAYHPGIGRILLQTDLKQPSGIGELDGIGDQVGPDPHLPHR